MTDAAGNEIVRHGPSGFLGEMNLLSGQTSPTQARRRRSRAWSRSGYRS